MTRALSYKVLQGMTECITVYDMLTQPKKSAVIVIRCTPAERDAMIARAQRAGKSLSDYLRGAGMHYAEPGRQVTANVRTDASPSRFLSSSDGRGGA